MEERTGYSRRETGASILTHTQGTDMDRGTRQRRRGGREQTTEAILDAAEELFSQRGFTAVSVRDIAAEAGVSHALVHRYLGSKADVYRAVFSRDADVIRVAATGQEDLLAAASLMLREGFSSQRRYVRLIAHSALHGLSYERTGGRFAATERLLELAQAAAESEGARDPDALDPRFAIAGVVALFLGWMATEDWLLRVAGLDDLSEEEVVDSFERVVFQILRANFPTEDAASR
jgi:AcrR family transcriptional regulator